MSTADKAIQLRIEHPEYSLQMIGTQLGVSRERIRQLLKKNHLPTVSTREYRYCWCGKRLNSNQKNNCSTKCANRNKYTEIPCTYCGKEKTVLKSGHEWINTKRKSSPAYKGRVFCDRTCFGKWFGKNYGVGTPNNPCHKG